MKLGFPAGPAFLIILGFILIVELISRKYSRLKIGRLGVLGIFIALLHLGRNEIASFDFLVDAVLSFAGIIVLILDKKDVERG